MNRGTLSAEEKREILRDTGAIHGLRTFVETGTADGGTVAALVEHFDRLVSIELEPGHYMNAVCQFAAEPKVTIVFGDSDPVLERLAPLLADPALFWLDAHYNGQARGREETPILRELLHLFFHRRGFGDVILIDDARMFGAHPGYPTLDEVADVVLNYAAEHTTLHVHDDIIWVLPPEAP